jgi:hypothetical protein
MMIRDFTFIKRCAPHLRVLSIAALLLGLSGCDWLGILAKETAIAATSHRGWDTFTFKGQLPAEFGIDAIAFYGPNEPGKASCQADSFEPGKTVTRRHAQRYTAEIQAQPQEFSFEIPLSYYKGLCGMRLGRVKLEINGRYGPLEWQQAYGRGSLYIEDKITSTTSDSENDSNLYLSATCTWLFQQSNARSRRGEIEKLLICSGAGTSITREDLSSKDINLRITSNPQERPYYDKTWIKFDSGWKPCLPKAGGWIKCQSPPTFKTFEMNGQTCTVYPGCTE